MLNHKPNTPPESSDSPHTDVQIGISLHSKHSSEEDHSEVPLSNKESHHRDHAHDPHRHMHDEHHFHPMHHPHKRVRVRHLVDREPGARKEFHQKLFKTPKEVVEAVIAAAEKKVALTLDKTIILGFMAGVYVAFGGFFALSVSQNLPTTDPGFARLLLGILFSFALLLIIFMGGELFTGNTMYLTVGLLSGKIRAKQVALNLICVYFSNWAGCVFAAYFFGYLTEFYAANPLHANLLSLAEHKLEMKPYVTFLRSIPANWLVCVAIFFNQTAEDVGGKILGMVYAVACFAAVGFEHCIANMFYVDLALMYGLDHTFGDFLGKNLILVTIGNIIGGAFFVGAISYYIYCTGAQPTDTKLEQQQIAKKQTDAKFIRFTWDKKWQ